MVTPRSKRPRKTSEEELQQRRRDLIERSIMGQGPEAVASRKRLAAEQAKTLSDRSQAQESGRMPGGAEGERAAVANDQRRKEPVA